MSRRKREIDFKHSAKRSFPQSLCSFILELLKPRELFVQSVHSSRVLVNSDRIIGTLLQAGSRKRGGGSGAAGCAYFMSELGLRSAPDVASDKVFVKRS